VTAARLAARCVELLGPAGGPVDVEAAGTLAAALAARLAVARPGEPVAAAVCDFRAERGTGADRIARLARIAARLPDGAPLVVVDHNQPRAWWRRVAGALLLVARGLPPRRARHPVATEVRDRGFAVEALRLAAGERLQLVLARRARSARTTVSSAAPDARSRPDSA
jgi:hypothetical protein